MTDPNETANLVGGITQAYREHAAEEETPRPVTYREATPDTIAALIDRYHEMADQGVTSVDEHLDLLGLGERIARYYSPGRRSPPGRC